MFILGFVIGAIATLLVTHRRTFKDAWAKDGAVKGTVKAVTLVVQGGGGPGEETRPK